jgi:DNA-binding NarL/FixJ family response regulator
MDDLRRAAASAEGAFAPVCASHASAVVAKDGAALQEISGAFARIGATLLAAEAAAEAADAYRAEGRHSSAVAATRKARALAHECEGARTLPLQLLNEVRVLTPREQEIAGLAARGLSSRVIAERLVISVRTVDNALQHVYGKLGLTGRAELGTALFGQTAQPPPSE